MKHFFTTLLLTAICASLHAQAPKDTVEVQGFYATGGQEGTLNAAVESAVTAGTLSNTVFKLAPFEVYVLISTIIVPEGEHLEIVAAKPGTDQNSAPPQIVWTASGGITTTYTFQCFGDLTMKNVWLRYADVAGSQIGSSIVMEDNPDPNVQEKLTFDGVIIDYGPEANGAGPIMGACDRLVAKFTNCYFRNCIDPHFRYYGRALSWAFESTGWHNDYVLFENCTFANIGYVYMQEDAKYGDEVYFNHCTFLNVVMFSLQSGWWYKMHVTNSIFLNPFMFGYIPANDEPGGSTINQITAVDSFGFAVPFTDIERQILFAYNSHKYEDWLVDWMRTNPYSDSLRRARAEDLIPLPQPMLNDPTIAWFDSVDANGNKAFPLMNTANLYDGTDPGFLVPPTNVDELKIFMQYKWSNNFDINWAYDRDSGLNQEWPLPENLAYTNEMLQTAAMGGFPLGDLYHWWPDEYAEWEAQKDDEHARIRTWLETGTDPGPATSVEERPGAAIPSDFILDQNYPNPFNPTTQIEYSIPRSGPVSLKVYNNLGQEVATLFDGNQKAGNYVATLNATGLASGVYLYRLKSGDVSITRKLVVMK